MNIDGSNVVLLNRGEAMASPVWLPDGSKVAYATASTVASAMDLWTINLNGTGKTRVRSFPFSVPINLFEMAWSPLGNVYTFTTPDGAESLGLSIADDINPGYRKLANRNVGSSWAPDGASILFFNGDYDYEVNPDGSNLRKVSSYSRGISSISPDGAFIVGEIYPESGPPSEFSIRGRSGTPIAFKWDTTSHKADWSRVPKNCYVSDLEGGGGVLAGDVDFYAGQCAVAVMPDGGLNGVLQQAIAIGPDQRLYHRALKPGTSGGAPTWTSFARVPGAGGNLNGILAKKIAIAASKDGSAQLVIINAADNLVYHAMRYANGTWSGFTALDGVGVAPNFAARDVAITIGGSTPASPGNAQVIANGLVRGDLYHRVRWIDGSWTPFAPMGPGGVATHEIALAAGEDGNTNVLAMTTLPDGSQGRIMQALRYASGNWTGWVTVGVPNGTTLSASSDLAVTRTLSGAAQLMFTDSAGNALFQERSSPNILEAWQTQVPNATIANTVGRGVSISAGATAGSTSQLLLTRTFPQ